MSTPSERTSDTRPSSVHDGLHHVAPTVGRHGLDWHFSCTAGPDAFCRAVWSCDCESVDPVRRDDGRWQHDPGRDRLDGEPEVRHVMEPGGPCTVLDWLTGGAPGEETFIGGSAEEPVRAGTIHVIWEGDGYLWEYADEVAPDYAGDTA